MSAVWVAELFFVEEVLGRGELAYGPMLSFWGDRPARHAGVRRRPLGARRARRPGGLLRMYRGWVPTGAAETQPA
jgi:hypothetical protein